MLHFRQPYPSSVYVAYVFDVPDGHSRAGNDRETNGSGETLVTLRIIVLEADLELDGLEEVSLLGLVRVLEKLLNICSDAGNGDFRHDVFQ